MPLITRKIQKSSTTAFGSPLSSSVANGTSGNSGTKVQMRKFLYRRSRSLISFTRVARRFADAQGLSTSFTCAEHLDENLNNPSLSAETLCDRNNSNVINLSLACQHVFT